MYEKYPIKEDGDSNHLASIPGSAYHLAQAKLPSFGLDSRAHAFRKMIAIFLG
ncbi:MAG TPA: hypothetical protein VN455_06340 [Methanotrichaceae archaeon]|nr:hypothetical protein [Methanotrichaceae archaeon]